MITRVCVWVSLSGSAPPLHVHPGCRIGTVPVLDCVPHGFADTCCAGGTRPNILKNRSGRLPRFGVRMFVWLSLCVCSVAGQLQLHMIVGHLWAAL